LRARRRIQPLIYFLIRLRWAVGRLDLGGKIDKNSTVKYTTSRRRNKPNANSRFYFIVQKYPLDFLFYYRNSQCKNRGWFSLAEFALNSRTTAVWSTHVPVCQPFTASRRPVLFRYII